MTDEVDDFLENYEASQQKAKLRDQIEVELMILKDYREATQLKMESTKLKWYQIAVAIAAGGLITALGGLAFKALTM